MSSESDPFAATAVAGSDATAATTDANSRPRDSRVTLEVGKRLGDRYDVLGYLGEGGMGAVYRAFDATLGVEVALKIVRGAFADDAALREEVRIAQKVTHENVCRTYDLEEVAGYQLVKMEYIAGETLAARLKERGALPIDETLRIARAIAAGLDAAHGRGIVHRDLKPGNVMLDGKRVVLMDFGLARHVTDEALERAGTPGYMAPEQLAGDRVTPAADLFALGCLVYEMLTGERAFAHGTMTEVSARRAEQPTPDVRAKKPATPRSLARATQLLMSDAPGPRSEGLRLLVGAPSNKRRWLPIAIAVGIGVLLGNAWLIYQALEPKPAEPWTPTIVDIPIQVEDGVIDRLALSPDGKTLAFIVDREYDNTGHIYTVPFPAGGVPKPWFGQPAYPIHGFRWRDDKSLVIGLDAPFTPKVGILDDKGFHEWGDGHDPAWCDGKIVALLNPYHYDLDNPQNRGDALVRYAAVDAKAEVLVPADSVLDYPRCDPSGKRLVVTRSRPPGLLLVENATPRTLTTERDQTAAFTHDGKAIVFGRKTGDDIAEIYVQSLGKDAAAQPIAKLGALAFVMEPTPDGLLFIRNEPKVAIIAHTRAATHTLSTEAIDVHEVLATPNNGIVGVWKNTVVWFDPKGARVLLEDGTMPVSDGTRVYFRRGLDEVWAMPLDRSTPATRIAKLPGRIVARALGPDGPHFAIESDTETRSVRIDAAGAMHEDGHEGLGVPAPSGPWRAIFVATATSSEATFRAPGQPTHTLPCVVQPAWLDDHHVLCATRHERGYLELEQLDVRDGSIERLDDWDDFHYVEWVVGSGTWFVMRGILQGRAQYMTNFNSRP